jgi:hypothetical protein
MDHPQEETHMDSIDNLRERFEALVQQTEHLKQQTHAFEDQTHALQAQMRTVERRLRWWRGLACGVGLLGVVSLSLPSGTAQSQAEPPLAQRVAALERKLQSVSVGENELVITGANLRLVNGLGATTTVNGLGNLLVGYNEERTSTPSDPLAKQYAHGLAQRGGGERAQFLALRRPHRWQG